MLYTSLAWPLRGRDAVMAFVEQSHAANPGPRVVSHEILVSRRKPGLPLLCDPLPTHRPFHWTAPTGERGSMSEIHAVCARRPRYEQSVGDNNFSMPQQDLVPWGVDFPRAIADPSPVLSCVLPDPGDACGINPVAGGHGHPSPSDPGNADRGEQIFVRWSQT